jgi:hypothetical protein
MSQRRDMGAPRCPVIAQRALATLFLFFNVYTGRFGKEFGFKR